MRVPPRTETEEQRPNGRDAPGGHGSAGTVPALRAVGESRAGPAAAPEPARVVLEGDAAREVRQAAAREGIGIARLVREAVRAYRRPSPETLRRYRAVRQALARLGADDRLLDELDNIILLAWARILRGGRR